MNSIQISDKANSLIKELEELVYLTVKHNSTERCLTKDISQNLGLMPPEDVEITRSILKRLKFYGKIENLPGNPDAWTIKRT